MISEHSSNPWKVVKLKDIASQIQYGYTAKAKGTESGPRFLRITDIQDDTVEWSTVPSCDIPTKDKEKYLLSEGDIVFARTGATVGKSYLIRGNVPEAVFASYLIRVRLQSDVDPKYINYFFRSSSYWRQISESSAGIGQPNVNGSKLADLQIPLTSPENQQRIVAEIEKQFSRLDEAVASLKRILANLKRYKAAVLKAAVEGKLTEQWRKDHPDVEPADQLLKHILTERRAKWEESVGAKQGVPASPGFGDVGNNDGDCNKGEAGESFASPLPQMKAKGIKPKDDSWKKKYKEPAGPDTANLPELPEGWVWTALGQLAWSVKDGPHYSPKYSTSGIPFISGGNIRPEGIDFSSAKFITPELHAELSLRCKPEHGDLLYTKGGTTGIARINTETRDFNVWVHVAVLKLVDSIKPFYLQNALNSTHCYKQSQKYTHGVGNQDLGLTRMIWITVPLPPLTEQKFITEEIERRLSVTKELEVTIETNLKRAERLRQTILQRAFSGGLV